MPRIDEPELAQNLARAFSTGAKDDTPPQEGLEAFVGALKGRGHAPDIADQETPEEAPPQAEELFPISGSMPEAQFQKRLRELEDDKQALANSLRTKEQQIEDLTALLDEANTRIATLLLERNEGIEAIIASLREHQVGGAANGPVGATKDSLSSIFSGTSQLQTRANEASLKTEVEDSVKLALDTLRMATNDAFNFSVATQECNNFWKTASSANNEKRPISAKMVRASMTSSSMGTSKQTIDYVIVIDNKIFYLPQSKAHSGLNAWTAFNNEHGRYTEQGGLFGYQSGSLSYDCPGNQDQPQIVQDKFTTIPAFIDVFVATALNPIISSNTFTKGAQSLKAMGLIP